MHLQPPDERNKAVTVFRLAGQAMKSFLQEETGVTAIEYALLAALIAIVVVGSVTATGNSLLGLWTAVSDAVAAAVGGV